MLELLLTQLRGKAEHTNINSLLLHVLSLPVSLASSFVTVSQEEECIYHVRRFNLSCAVQLADVE
jgi:hypothetical protein